ncbi:MAG: hypothetical protein WDM80_10845 [Limisphaerales bacterium]
MKIPFLIICVFLLVGCGCGKQKSAMTDAQVMAVVMKELPPLTNGDAIFTRFSDGTWTISRIKNLGPTNTVGHDVAVAMVRDSDGKVTILK